MSRISLEAVPGRMLPVQGRRGHFYGYKRADDASADEVAHAVPDGRSYALSGAFAVEGRADGMPRDPYLRRAVLRGDLRAAKAAPQPAPKAAPKGE